jgi:glucosamine 6-phosphate synthetase-like amidotransferase/phosphosugar isomerase protein
MCGVVGLVYERSRADLGQVASELLKTLEYRGYDSTGAAIQGDGPDVVLRKGVGAPSVMVTELGIPALGGRVFCGQVRWATFGAVTHENSQPHVVRCKTFLYGAHNGNVTNCDALKLWLLREGHEVLSDNDGEMVVHVVEHCFARELDALPVAERGAETSRRAAMRRAIVEAASLLEGSFAAVIVDPVTRVLFAIKLGSSLYFGFGQSSAGGRFALASSDLSSVLKLTRVLVPLAEGELVEYDALGHQVFAIRKRTVKTPEGPRPYAPGEPMPRDPSRSRLRAKDAALVPPFESFMDQEIHAQVQTSRAVISLFLGGSEALVALGPLLDARPPADVTAIRAGLEAVRDPYADDEIEAAFHALVAGPSFAALLDAVPDDVLARRSDGPVERLAEHLASSEAGLFADLLGMARSARERMAVLLLDALLEGDEVREFRAITDRFSALCKDTMRCGGRIYVVCCGSSQNAAKAGALFFHELAKVELTPVLPGEFRAQCAGTIRDGDLVVAVSQSGETKDLIDILNDLDRAGHRVTKVALVNNVSSTLAQEKSDLVIPLRCGPEVAVPATKSFMAQLTVFYALALAVAERLGTLTTPAGASGAGDAPSSDRLALQRQMLGRIPALIRETIATTDAEVERAATLCYLAPSIHILAIRLLAVAKEGALKIREVVLNHTEGFEGSEFKHGPNTILGQNTLYGPREVQRLLRALGLVIEGMSRAAIDRGLGAEAVGRLARAATDGVFGVATTPVALHPDEASIFEAAFDRDKLYATLTSDYPLFYVTGPEARDVALTVSQINAHKIRGASTVVIAEDDPALHVAASKAPADTSDYAWVYIALPHTGDTLLTVFSSTVVLQRLALKMSVAKVKHLDRMGIENHGVHPDVPKNVSKSITVD